MVSFDAGSIVGTADLDLTPFHAKLDEAEARAERFESHTILANLGIEDGEALRRLADMDDRLDRYSARRDSASVSLDISPALRDLVRLNAELDVMTRDRTINVRETSSSGAGGFGGGGGSGIGRFGALAGGAALFGGPLGAVAGGGLLAGGAAIGVAGAGVGALALGAVPEIKRIVDAQQELTKARQSYNLAVLEGSKSGEHDALAKQAQVLGSLTAAEKAALGPLQQLHDAWTGFQHALAPASIGLLGSGVHVITDVLPQLVPLANAGGRALGGLFREADQAVKSSEFRTVLDQLAHQAPGDITALGHIVGNLAGAFAHAAVAAGPLVHDVLTGLEHGSAALDRFTQGSEFLAFLDYARREGPVVGHALTAVGGALLAVVKGLAPMGDLLLRVTPGIAHLVSSVAPLAPELLTLWAAVKGFTVINDAVKAVKALDVSTHALVAGSLVGLILELGVAYETSQTFRNGVNGAFSAAGHAAQTFGHAVQGGVGTAIDAIDRVTVGIVHEILGLPGQLEQVGEHAVIGLAHGIANSAGAAFDALGGLAGGLIHHVESIFGIASPSKVMMGVGAQIDQGLAAGIVDNSAAPLNAIGDVAGSVVSIARQAAFEAQTLLASAATASSVAKIPSQSLSQILGGFANPNAPGKTNANKPAVPGGTGSALLQLLGGTITGGKYTKDQLGLAKLTNLPGGADIAANLTSAYAPDFSNVDLSTPWGSDPGGGGGGSGSSSRIINAGAQITQGLSAAIKHGVPAVRTEIQKLRDTILNEYRSPAQAAERRKALDELASEGPKALDKALALASDKARVLGHSISDSLVKAIEGGTTGTYLDTLSKKVTGTLTGPANEAERRSLLSLLSGQIPLLAKASKSYADATEKVKGYQNELTSLQQTIASDRTSLASTLGAGASLTAAASSGQGITSYLANQLTVLQSFAGELRQLKAAGIGPAALEMVVAAGPIAGGAIAKALLSSGTTGQASSLVDAIQGLAGTVADETEQTIYAPQLDTLNGKIDASNAALANIEAAITKSAHTTGTAVAQGLTGTARTAKRKAAGTKPKTRASLR